MEENQDRTAISPRSSSAAQVALWQHPHGVEEAAEGVEGMVARDPHIAVTSEIWDANPWLLGTPERDGRSENRRDAQS